MKQISQKQFDELIDILLGSTTYNINERIDLEEAITQYSEQMSLDWTEGQRRIFMKRVYDTGLFSQFFDEGGPVLTDEITLSDTGRYVKEGYDSYSEYYKEKAKENRKKERQKGVLDFHDKMDKIIKPWIALLGGVVAIVSIVVSIIALTKTKELGNSVQRMEQQRSGVKENITDTPKLQSLKDTLLPVKPR